MILLRREYNNKGAEHPATTTAKCITHTCRSVYTLLVVAVCGAALFVGGRDRTLLRGVLLYSIIIV